MFYYATLFIMFTLCGFLKCELSENFDLDNLPEDAMLNFTRLATKYGHPPQQYTVITEDNYLLTLYRLPGRSRYPVLLMHGIYDSSDTFVIRGNGSLGITLANDGYDVWIGNFRGNRYSRKHVFLNPDKDTMYWKFSFHQMGYFDLPAIIDTVLKLTERSTLTAIAHSQGTTAFFVLGSTRKEYNAKINVIIALAPVSYLQNVRGPTSTLVKLSLFLEKVVNDFNVNELFGDNGTVRSILRIICPEPVIGYAVCIMGIVFKLAGYDPIEIEPEFGVVATAHFPAGGSAMTGLHFLQIGRRRIFANYDYGTEQNWIIYNSSTPKTYELKNVVMPVALITARNDRLSALEDVDILRQQLPNVVYNFVNPRLLFNHVDYIFGRRMDKYLFPYITRVLRLYNGFLLEQSKYLN